jgi:glutathione S-transferase
VFAALQVDREQRTGRAIVDEIVFYTNPMSRGRIVRWMLEELGQPSRTEILDFSMTMKAPSYRAINPMGKVPAGSQRSWGR